ncbi:hypothetical protein NW752_009070 [Fusarium irregulare]|uniref:Ankyrin repeat protein n=1 Tax=Fusarium irregulare TaxID=2494466 RepID=A0A9W8U6J9_9HYPO|nr:hypothetical protein NW766_008595 [Fusarium irregulare]KAJ4009896.1 hypothetical protein NW752_009070 [Fusarium irregulare]
MACSVQDPALFQFLRKHDAIDMDSVAETGKYLTPLIAASFHGHIDRLNVLLTMGVGVYSRLTTGIYADALSAAVDVQSMRAIRQLLRWNPSHPKEDALGIWRKNHLEASTPDYSASLSKKCQTLLSWLLLAILQCRHEEESQGSETGAPSNKAEGGNDDADDFLGDGCGDSSDEVGNEDDGYDTTTQQQDGRDKGGDPEKDQEQEHEHEGTDIHSEGGLDSSSPILHTARRDNDNVAASSADEVLKSLNDLLSWLHQDCVQEPQVVQHELAKTFGFSFSEQNDNMAVELVRNALLKGFRNALRLTYKQRTLNDITQTWARFLNLAEDNMGLIDVLQNAFDKGNSAELARLHEENERLANGGVGQIYCGYIFQEQLKDHS